MQLPRIDPIPERTRNSVSAHTQRITAQVLREEFTVNPWEPGLSFQQYIEQMAPYVADRIDEALRDNGIVGFIRNDAPRRPRVYTDADAEAWSDT